MIPLDSFSYVADGHNANDWHRAIEDQLSVIDTVCREHGLRYALAFGGLLGAIRHEGMIPWDNDADIVMFEKDYLKLQELSRAGQLPEGYQLVDRTVEDDYSLLFGRFINTKTSCALSTSSFNGGANGVFIDIFILYPVPEEPEAQRDCITDFLVWEEMQCHIKRRCKFRSQLFRERWLIAKKIEREQGREAALAYCEQRFRSKLPSYSTKCIHSSGGSYEGYPVLDTAWFEQPVYKPFGSHTFAVPNGHLSFFRRFYSNGWRMFPQGERFRAYSCANLNIPGTDLSQDYMQFIDADCAVADFDALKQLKMDEMILQSDVEPMFWGMKAELAAQALDRTYKPKLPHYRQALTAERLGSPDLDLNEMRTICEETEEVLRFQKTYQLRYWRIALPVNPALLSVALWSYYLVRPDFWTVEKIIRLQQHDPHRCVYGALPLDQILDTVLERTGDLYEGIDAGDAACIDACTKILDRVGPATRHARVGHAYSLAKQATESTEAARSALAQIEAWCATFPDDDYLHLYAAECAFWAGDVDRANQLFAQLAGVSMNGMVLLAAKRFCHKQGLPFSLRNIEKIPKLNADSAKQQIVFPRFRSVSAAFLLYHAYRHHKYKELRTELKRVRAAIKPLAAKTSHYHALRRLSSDRFAAWERTYPRKQTILDSSAAGKFDEVRVYARPYIEGVYRLYDNDHMGLAIDEDILHACLPLFIEDRGHEFAQEYQQLIPAPHRISIDIWLKEKGIDHPYLTA